MSPATPSPNNRSLPAEGTVTKRRDFEETWLRLDTELNLDLKKKVNTANHHPQHLLSSTTALLRHGPHNLLSLFTRRAPMDESSSSSASLRLFAETRGLEMAA